MKRFVFVRHSQASALAENYDQVSELGYQQAYALAEHWLALESAPTRIFTGTLERHRQTLDAMRSTLAASGAEWPDVVELEGLNEHSGADLVNGLLPRLADADPAIAQFLESPPEDRHERLQTYFGFFRALTQRWVQGEFREEPAEHWLDFRARSRSAVEQILRETQVDETALVVTSGGVVAATAGQALELSEQRTLELSWIVHNTAMTELFHRGSENFRLKSFNRTPHLPPDLHTFV